MRVVYRLEAAGGVPAEGQADPVDFPGGIRAEWEVGEGYIAAIRLILSGITLQRGPTGSIRTDTEEIKAKAYSAIGLIANNVFSQTGVDAFAPSKVIDGYPYDMGNNPDDISPEGADEQKEFERDGRWRLGGSRTLKWRILGEFDPSAYAAKVAHSPALANFADGLRAESPFVKYEQFYKVVEHFFPDTAKTHGGALEGPKLDRAVSAHISGMDARFTEDKVRELREVRIRSVHAHPYNTVGSHLSPQDIRDTRQVLERLPDLRDLARLLLENPPP